MFLLISCAYYARTSVLFTTIFYHLFDKKYTLILLKDIKIFRNLRDIRMRTKSSKTTRLRAILARRIPATDYTLLTKDNIGNLPAQFITEQVTGTVLHQFIFGIFVTHNLTALLSAK